MTPSRSNTDPTVITPKSARWPNKLLAAAIGILSLMLITEIGLRLVFGLGNPVLIQPDLFCGYSLKPNQSVRRFFVNTHVNQFGMRSEDVSPQKSPGIARVMFLGDSVTYGTSQVDQSKIFSELIRASLAKQLKQKIEVLNVSAAAWAIGNELAYVKSRGLFGSDLVVLVINKGDLTQRFCTMQEVGDGLPLKRPFTAIGELASRFYLILNGRKAKMDAGINVDPALAADSSTNLSLIGELKRLAASQTATLVIAYVPLRKDVALNQQSSAPKILIDWARANDVSVLDLTEAEARYPAADVETADHIHFNAQGNSALAAPLGRFVLEHLNESLHTASARSKPQ